MIIAMAGGELVLLRELQGRALDAVARRWAHHPVQARSSSDPTLPTPAEGLAVLVEAIGAPIPVTSVVGDADRDRRALRQVVEVTGRLADAARQVATAASSRSERWSRAVETADAVSTTAQALRMLAELELAAIPGP